MSTIPTEQNHSKLLNIQTNANGGNGNKPPSSDDLNSNEENESFKHYNQPIENTPFRVIGNERDGFIIVMGRHRLTDPVDTPTQAEKLLVSKPFQLIFHMVATMLEINEELRKSTLADTNISK